MRVFASVAMLLLLSGWPIHSQPASKPATGTVRGQVVDADGNPVAGIDVRVGPVEEIQFRRPVVATTDEEGRFSFDIKPGRYGLNAYDETRGYLNTYLAINSFGHERSYVVIDVAEDKTLDDILVETTPIAARLEILVLDDQTGDPLSGAGLRVEVFETPEIFLDQTAGRVDGMPVECSIPAELDLRLTANARGHADQVLELDGSPRVRFRQGESRTIEVKLKRTADQ